MQDTSGLHPAIIEVTEGLDLDSPAVQHLRTLRQAGADVAIDDFGVQHSDLSRLKRVPAGSLKIDRSLVDDLTGARPLDLGVVRAIVALADAAGLGLVAEGIETAEQRRLVTEMGCRLGQGYLLGRPVPAASVRGLLALPALVA